MTLKEKLETIKGKKIAIWCENEVEAIKLTRFMNEITKENDPNNYYDYSNESTCYTLEAYNRYKQWGYSSRSHYIREKFEIISYKDFVNNYEVNVDTDIINISFSDITDLLNEKYGKYNWVIK